MSKLSCPFLIWSYSAIRPVSHLLKRHRCQWSVDHSDAWPFRIVVLPPPFNHENLMSLEASGLNLGGTDLVVPSACQPGVGNLRNGEGSFG